MILWITYVITGLVCYKKFGHEMTNFNYGNILLSYQFD